jgi:signal transduction histidine kinase
MLTAQVTYAWPLIKSAFRNLRLRDLILALDLLMPPMAFTVLLPALFFVSSLIWPEFWGHWGALWWGSLLAIQAILVAVALFLAKASFKVWRSLALAPVFLLWRVAVAILAILTLGDKRWLRTQRNGEAVHSERRNTT